MILRNLDFNLSLYLVKGISRFYKTDIPFFYDGILFKDLQSSKLNTQEDKEEEDEEENEEKKKEKKSEIFFFFCLGLKTDTSLDKIPFYIRNIEEDKEKKENKNLKLNKSKELVIDSYYTSYTYKFKFGVYRFLRYMKVRNTVRYFKSKRFRKRRRQRRLLKRFTFFSQRKWWMDLLFTRKLYKKEYGVNAVKAQFTETSFNLNNQFLFFKNQSLFFYRRLLYFFSAMFFNILISHFYITSFFRNYTFSILQMQQVSFL